MVAMEVTELKPFLMSMPLDERKSFAKRCETTYGFLVNVAYGYKRAGETLAILIERESKGRVPCEVTRPDVPWFVLRKPKTKPQSPKQKGAVNV